MTNTSGVLQDAGISYPSRPSDLTTGFFGGSELLTLLVFCVVLLCVVAFSNRIGGVMVSVLTSSAVDRGFEPRSGQTKGFSTKHAALRRKSKDWLARNQNNMSE